MRIAFNAQLLSYRPTYRAAGIARYIDRLLAELPGALGPGDQMVTFVAPDVPANAASVAWSRVLRTRLPTHRPMVRILWEQTVFPIRAATWGADVLHAPAYVLPVRLGFASVVTFHDLSFFRLPEAFKRPNRIYLQAFARVAARRADRIITVSESTRQDVIRILGARPDAVEVVPNGVDARFRPEPDARRLEAFRAARGLPERYILYLGTLEPRKNLPGLLRAYARARRAGVTEPLVIAGGPGWGDLPLARLIDELDLRSVVRPVGYVPADEEPLWFAAATLFAYPSLYEGFGLPALQAMACGTPVVASDRSSLPEVVGNAGLLPDPENVDALAHALVEPLRDEALRRDLAVRGVKRASRFSWLAAANRTVDVYRDALVAPRPVAASGGGRREECPAEPVVE